MPNPYDSLPTYLTEEVSMLSAVAPAETTTTTQSPSATPPKVAVNTADIDGSPIFGLWTTAQSMGFPLASGFAPVSFPVVPGSAYVVCVTDSGSHTFSRWADGSTSPCVTISPTQDTGLTAYYDQGTSTTSSTSAVTLTTTTILGSVGHRRA